MAQPPTLFVDDQDPQVQYLCPSVHQAVVGSYYNNTWTTVNSDACSKGWFQYTFYGTEIHVQTAVASSTTSYSVKIDDGEFVSQSGTGAYTSPALSDGKHTITYAANIASMPPVFDYLTVTAAMTTSLKGRTIAVDDADNCVVYSGSWSTIPPAPIAFDYATSLYRDTTHWTSNIGDSLQFKFEGSSISVFGIATNISAGGNITATYTIDGVSKSQSLPSGTLDSLPMVNLFHADVQPGSHTLIVNITDIQASRALGIDLIAYNATFDSVSSVPANAASSSSSGSAGKSLSSGSKAGIAIGTLIGIALMCFVAFIIVRRQLRRRTKNYPLTKSFESGSQKSALPHYTW